MTFDFINPLMLIGLAGVSLPVLAHLLSRKRYDVEEWGAMQFLELGRKTQRTGGGVGGTPTAPVG